MKPKLSYEQKLELVKSIVIDGKPYCRITEKEGIKPSTLGQWVRNYRSDVIRDLHYENECLKKELQEARSALNIYLVDDATKEANCGI